MGQPTFGCPRCRVYPNPRDDELCLDCTRAKLAFLSSINARNGGTSQTPPPSSRSAAAPQPGKTGIVGKIFKALFLGQVGEAKIPRLGLIFLFGFVIFFLFAGRGMMMNSFRSHHQKPKPPNHAVDQYRNDTRTTSNPLPENDTYDPTLFPSVPIPNAP